MSKRQQHIYNLPVVVEQDKDGFFAFAPGLQGCYTQGDTHEEAIANLREAIQAHLLDRLSTKEEILSASDSVVSVSSLRVAI